MDQPESYRPLYEEWVRSYAPQLYRYAYRLSGRQQIAEDLLQETFMEAWRSIGKQKDPTRARAWLFQILRYRFAHHRRDSRHDRRMLRLADNSHPPDSAQLPLDRLAERDSIQSALNSLTPRIRQTFLMVFSEGRTCRETSQSLRIPIGTVLSRLDSARQKLRKAMGAEGSPGSVAASTNRQETKTP